MALKIINLQEIENSAKATIHNNGTLGFNTDAITLMNIKDDTAYCIAYSEEKNTLYLVEDLRGEGNSINVTKNGGYFGLKMPAVLKMLGYNYHERKCIFSIKYYSYKDNKIDGKVWKLTIKREIVKGDTP